VAFIVLMKVGSFDKLILAMSLGCGVVVSLVHPVISVSFFLLNLILRPWEYLPDTAIITILPKGLAALCFVSWLIFNFRVGKFKIIWNGSCLLFMLFLGWAFIAAILGGGVQEGTRFFLERFIPIFVLFFLIFNSVHDRSDLRLVEVSLIIAVLGMVISAEVYTKALLTGERLMGGKLFGNANDLAATIVMVLPFLFFPLQKRFTYTWIPILVTLIFLLYGIILADSRSAKLALAAMVGVHFLITYRITLTRLILGGVLVVVLLLTLMMTSRSASDLRGSSFSRINYAITGLKMLKSNPVWGVGLGNYPKRYEEFTSDFSEYGERTAHSSWVLVMAEAGLPGLVLFLAFFFSVLGKAWRMRHARAAFFLAMVGYGIMMSFLSHTYLFLPYILFALVLVGYRIFSISEAQGVKYRPKQRRRRMAF
jgi:putative inorganic carbon (HCO3(-)) transporter